MSLEQSKGAKLGPGLCLTRAKDKERMGKGRGGLGKESLDNPQGVGLAVPAATRGTGPGKTEAVSGRCGTLTSSVAAAAAAASCARLQQGQVPWPLSHHHR